MSLIKIHEEDGILVPQDRYFSAYILLTPATQRRLGIEAKTSPRPWALVLDGQLLSVIPEDVPLEGPLPIGSFANVRQIGELAEKLQVLVELVPYDADRAEARRESAIKAMLEPYARRPEGREWLARENPGLSALVERQPDLWEAVLTDSSEERVTPHPAPADHR